MKKIFSCSLLGLDCKVIEVEADISRGLPYFSIVGLGDASVQESKERVRASIKNCDMVFPANRKIINLAPAQIRKHGSLFDLPIAVSILCKNEQLKWHALENSLIIGELSLNGDVKGVKGVAAITHHAKLNGFKRIFLPHENALEASFIDGIEIVALKTLKDLIEICNKNKIKIFSEKIDFNSQRVRSNLFSEIIGLEMAKRGVIIAAAGNHNVLMQGSPGCGKTLLARSINSILPEMSKQESLQTTKIFSITGGLSSDQKIITDRPYREVHHSASVSSVIGGGKSNPVPGEISLAHNGVLFFDEIVEFNRATLEALRQPLEDRKVNISRHGFKVAFPCNFIFIGAMNPCPCGFKNDVNIKCKCREYQIQNYQRKLSGPILDRFDVFLRIERSRMQEIFSKNTGSNIEEVRAKVLKARKIQVKRFLTSRNIATNSEMGIREVKKFCKLNKKCERVLTNAANSLKLSNRAYLKTLKTARTIADLDQKECIEEIHLNESLQFRKNK
ncbi:YifB family Mg chelatase-like AAA ATPase [Candidatus Peregrinibacteria bacterium]|nr:YifB family Mg chelatase-like AAA ATPase [Candidatus Peregrinibacteria bacterium]